jgi:predicted dienelactone hydrolase
MTRTLGFLGRLGIGLWGGLAVGAEPNVASYDPLLTAEHLEVQVLEFEVTYGRENRVVPLRIYLAENQTSQPAVLFSHGLGGSNRGSNYLGEHWARRGYAAVFMQHVGSDEAVGRDRAPRERMAALNAAANARNTLDRWRDVPAVIDALQSWNDDETHALDGRMDLSRIGMSGHSFGAVTTQGVSGQRQGGRAIFAEERIKAALVLSPSSPERGNAKAAFGAVTMPWMLMTGTRDVAAVGNHGMASRLAVFPALPDGDKYELVLEGGEHHAFTDDEGRGRARNPNHHAVIIALSTAFWDAYLKNDDAALGWLKGESSRDLLEPEDGWQMK